MARRKVTQGERWGRKWGGADGQGPCKCGGVTLGRGQYWGDRPGSRVKKEREQRWRRGGATASRRRGGRGRVRQEFTTQTVRVAK